MLARLRDLTSRERRTMLACWGGWTLDGFDQQLYSYVVPTVGSQGPHRDHPGLLHGLLQRQARMRDPSGTVGQSSPMRSDVLGCAGRGCWCRMAPLPLVPSVHA